MQESLPYPPPLWGLDQPSQSSLWTLPMEAASSSTPDPQGARVDPAPFPAPEHPLSAKSCAELWRTAIRVTASQELMVSG